MEKFANPGDPSFRKPRIMIVDDVETIRRGLRSILGEAVCGEAENGQEAIHRAMELHPDLIVLDWTMPVMNGLEAAKAIRSLVPETKIIVFSIHDGDMIEQEALRAGADVFLRKTSKADKILKTIRELLAPSGFDFSALSSYSESDGRTPRPLSLRSTASS